jgi:hypothetical protein
MLLFFLASLPRILLWLDASVAISLLQEALRKPLGMEAALLALEVLVLYRKREEQGGSMSMVVWRAFDTAT